MLLTIVNINSIIKLLLPQKLKVLVSLEKYLYIEMCIIFFVKYSNSVDKLDILNIHNCKYKQYNQTFVPTKVKSASESRKVSLNRNVYDFFVKYCNSVDKFDILNIHKYLMTKNDIK